ncbi:hypothetical protein B0J13DRAFT_4107 [Dactylonectria estremocensis]|uniref:Uncharacterized protein n=1 Tax=Dactylonectria estremocensis TaxID=1079267 RepID=A0A9P9FI09_9HYPO|nr:hypothetical protein B0J13DRAFT_4107 [Dactylonectria estremocensis]
MAKRRVVRAAASLHGEAQAAVRSPSSLSAMGYKLLAWSSKTDVDGELVQSHKEKEKLSILGSDLPLPAFRGDEQATRISVSRRRTRKAGHREVSSARSTVFRGQTLLILRLWPIVLPSYVQTKTTPPPDTKATRSRSQILVPPAKISQGQAKTSHVQLASQAAKPIHQRLLPR